MLNAQVAAAQAKQIEGGTPAAAQTMDITPRHVQPGLSQVRDYACDEGKAKRLIIQVAKPSGGPDFSCVANRNWLLAAGNCDAGNAYYNV
jgi:hypothetical protein